MMKNFKKVTAILLSLSMVFAYFGVGASGLAYADGGSSVVSNNKMSNIYKSWGGNWSQPVRSNLYLDGKDIVRVEYIASNNNSYVVAEKYDDNYNLKSSKIINMELPIWGGFYSTKKYNFIIFGKNNTANSDGAEVIRIVKYDKSWNKLGSASVHGANTVEPFSAGSLRCTDKGNMLYIKTSHKMYNGHQASMTLNLRISDMKITDSHHGIEGLGYGYVSHSFNQFILIDKDDNIVSVDHGDAYPRSLVMVKYSSKAGSEKMAKVNYGDNSGIAEIFKIPGGVGANNTGVQLGGFADTDTGYLVSYNYNPSSSGGGYNGHSYSPIKLAYAPKSALGGSGVVTKNINSVGTNPMLAKLSSKTGFMLWNDDKNNLCYVKYDSNGNVTKVNKKPNVFLSDCQPIRYKKGVLWYYTDNSAPEFIYLTSEGEANFDNGDSDSSDWSDTNDNDKPSDDLSTGSSKFKDVKKSDWFYEAVMNCRKHGYVKGVSKSKFAPSGNATREMFVTILYRIAGKPSVSKYGKVPFVDYEKNMWSSDAVKWAYFNKIVKGTSKVTFSPKKNVTNEQIMTLLYRYNRLKGSKLKKTISNFAKYPSYKNASSWAEKAVKWSIANKIIQTKNNRFIPKRDSIRAELAYMLNGYVVAVKKANDNPDNNKPDDNKPDDNKPDDNKPDDNKPDDNKPDDNKPDDNKPDDNKPDDNKPDDNKPDDNETVNIRDISVYKGADLSKLGLVTIDGKKLRIGDYKDSGVLLCFFSTT